MYFPVNRTRDLDSVHVIRSDRPGVTKAHVLPLNYPCLGPVRGSIRLDVIKLDLWEGRARDSRAGLRWVLGAFGGVHLLGTFLPYENRDLLLGMEELVVCISFRIGSLIT